MPKKTGALVAAIIWMILGSGCATTELRYVMVALPLPPRPELPAVTASDLACVSDEAYERIEERDRRRREYAEELEATICGTYEEPPDERCR